MVEEKGAHDKLRVLDRWPRNTQVEGRDRNLRASSVTVGFVAQAYA